MAAQRSDEEDGGGAFGDGFLKGELFWEGINEKALKGFGSSHGSFPEVESGFSC